MKAKALSVLKYLLLLALGFGLLYFAFKDIDFSQMLAELAKANYLWVLLSMLCSIVACYSRAVRWNMLIHPLGYQPKVRNTYAAVMAGYLANLAFPRMGEITRCGALNQSERVPFDELIGTVVVERTLDLIMLLLVILTAIVVEYDLIWGFLYKQFFKGLIDKTYTLAHSPIAITVIILILGGFILIILWLYRIRKQFAWFDKALKLFAGIVVGIKSVLKMKRIGVFLFHTFFIWIMYFFMSYTCFFALGATSELGFKAGLLTLVTGGLGMTAPVQGGIGVYHLIVSQGLLLFNIPVTEGLVYATIVHTSQTLLVLLIGGLSVIYLFFAKKQVNYEQA